MQSFLRVLSILILIVAGFYSCKIARAEVYPFVYKAGFQDIQIKSSNSAHLKKRVPVTIFTPSKVRGNVLVLPGWKFNRKRWLKETKLVALSKQHGFRLICPEMNTSLYASNYFPETRLKWSATPGLKWIVEILIPELQIKKIFLNNQDNFLLGLSTGGRGVVQIGLAKPELWRAAASLSGDFDQTQMPRDKLMIALYGPYNQFKKRWETIDNPWSKAKDWKLPLFLSHGQSDRIVPFSESKRYYKALEKSQVFSEIVFKPVAAGHDFKFWDSQVEPVIEFFNKYRRN